MNTAVQHPQGDRVPCIRNADHVTAVGADVREVELCGSCGKRFLRHKHEPTEDEMTLLALLRYFTETEDSKMYAITKNDLLDLRGPRYCGGCRASFVPISARMQ
jgi:hypothetical protein